MAVICPAGAYAEGMATVTERKRLCRDRIIMRKADALRLCPRTLGPRREWCVVQLMWEEGHGDYAYIVTSSDNFARAERVMGMLRF